MSKNKPNLKNELMNAKKGGYAVGAFNIFNYDSIRAVLDVADALKAPVILQTSVSTVKQFTPRRLIELLNTVREDTKAAVCVHLDHCTDVNLAKTCIDSGWDSVMLDLSRLPFEENLALTNEILKYAKKAGGVCVESELGVISGVEDEISAEMDVQPEYAEAISYLNQAKVDAFAPAIGTAHGLYKKEVKLNYDLISRLSKDTDVPVVIHGGTGLTPEQFEKLIKCGAAKINVSTALKLAYFEGTSQFLSTRPDNHNPLEMDKSVQEYMRKAVEEHIRWFGAEGKRF